MRVHIAKVNVGAQFLLQYIYLFKITYTKREEEKSHK